MNVLETPPCFLYGTIIQGIDRNIPIQTLQKGDRVFVGSGRAGIIKDVYTIRFLSSLSCPIAPDLVVSPSQPVRRIMKRVSRKTHPWKIAGDLNHLGRDHMGTGWFIVLEGGEGIVRTQDWECVTLGHGIVDDPVTAHPYWSTQRAIWDFEGFRQ
jgi:hypothetical protein